VELFAHGWLPNLTGWYFIDMEYCPETLEHRIREYSKMGLGVGAPSIRNKPSRSPQTTTSPSTDKDDPHATIRPRRDGAPNEPLEEEQMAFAWEPVMEILLDITSGLAYLHGKGIVHRDLKPSNGSKPCRPLCLNIVVLLSLKDGRWKLSDFGAASRATSDRLRTTEYQRGTSGYRAPEVLTQSRYNQKSDIFALGCIMYEVITGRKLFESDWNIHEYSTGERKSILPGPWPPVPRESVSYKLGELAEMLVSAYEGDRPSAEEVVKNLGKIWRENIHSSGGGFDDSSNEGVDRANANSIHGKLALEDGACWSNR
jgi:serine/threonine protein kinase